MSIRQHLDNIIPKMSEYESDDSDDFEFENLSLTEEGNMI